MTVFTVAMVVRCAESTPHQVAEPQRAHAVDASSGDDAGPTPLDAAPDVWTSWLPVTPFAATAFTKPTTFFVRESGSCQAMHYDGHAITYTVDDVFGAAGLNLAAVGDGPPPRSRKRLLRYAVVLESGTFTSGPYRFRLDEVESHWVDDRGKRVAPPPGWAEGAGGSSPPTFTVVAEDTTGLMVVPDARAPLTTYDPRTAQRWFTREADCATARPAE